MKLQHKTISLITALAALLPAAALAQDTTTTPQSAAPAATDGRKTVAIVTIDVNPAVREAAARKKISMERVVQSLDIQIPVALESTRKYNVITRAAAKKILVETKATGRAFAFAGADYMLDITIDDFQDVVEHLNGTWGNSIQRRTIRLSAVGKIHDLKTQILLPSANFQVVKIHTEEKQAGISSDGELSDSLLVEVSRDMAEKIANRLMDAGFPARVLAITGKQVTLSRGESGGIAVGQTWEAFALGETLVDPDTGAVLGQEELSVAKVRITRVNPNFSSGEIIGENLGLAKGAILRRVEK